MAPRPGLLPHGWMEGNVQINVNDKQLLLQFNMCKLYQPGFWLSLNCFFFIQLLQDYTAHGLTTYSPTPSTRAILRKDIRGQCREVVEVDILERERGGV